MSGSGLGTSPTDQEYYYALVGNRHSRMVNTGTPTGLYRYVTDESNRLIEEFGPVPTAQGGGLYHLISTYDAGGSLVRSEKDGKEVTLYYYDESGHLLKVTKSNGVA